MQALGYFQKVVSLARTIDDLTTAFACMEAAKAQQQLIASNETLRAIVAAL